MEERKYKYQRLLDYFEGTKDENIVLSFHDIENILGFPIEKSAYQYEAYWFPSENHRMPLAWNRAGYRILSLSLEKETVTFTKNDSNLGGVLLLRPEDEFCFNEEWTDEVRKSVAKEGVYYAEQMENKEYARLLSWEYCYKAFLERRLEQTEETYDYLALQLGFFLASWGMYRGSSFLLKMDYKVHTEAIKCMLERKYSNLFGICCEELGQEQNLDLLMEVADRVRTIYSNIRKQEDGKDEITDTLLTKILLGVYGCVPAYDRLFIKGLSFYKVAHRIFSRQSVEQLCDFYIENQKFFDEYRGEISLKSTIGYPEMKYLDMCFWQIGYEMDQEDELLDED